MWPGYPYKNIDLIFAPKHDNIPYKNNVIDIFSAPNIIDKELLKFRILNGMINLKTFPAQKLQY